MNRVIGKVLTKASNRRRSKEWSIANSARKKQNDKTAYENNKSAKIKQATEWNKTNRVKRNIRLREWANKYMKEKKASDPGFHLRCKLRSRMYTVFKRTSAYKVDKVSKLTGCSPSVLNNYINSLVSDDDNPSDLNVDHVFPLVIFDMTKPPQQRMSCHWSNLQPLTAAENGSKSDKLPTKAMAARVERWAWPPGVTEDMLPDIYTGWATPLRM
jgi:hypothetical protein